jgi:hypothetical protein
MSTEQFELTQAYYRKLLKINRRIRELPKSSEERTSLVITKKQVDFQLSKLKTTTFSAEELKQVKEFYLQIEV